MKGNRFLCVPWIKYWKRMRNGEITSVHLHVLSWNSEQISMKFKRARLLSWFSIGVNRPSVVLYMINNSELIIFSKADCCTEIVTGQRDCDFDLKCFRHVDWLTKAIVMVDLSQYLTNLMHKICFTVSFISCLYMFRAHVLETCRGME